VSSTSSKKIRKWISKSFAKSKAKKLRERFQPKFSSSFELLNPEMDDSVYRRLKELKNSVATKEKIDNKEMEMRAMQFKILDIVRPMLFIWETAQEETVRDAAKVAIKQWAHAFFACTDFRRNNLLKQTNPSFVAMLKREKNFDEKEFEMLFGDTFLKALLKTAKADAVLAAIPNGRNGGPSIRPSSGGRGGRGFHGTGSNQTNRFTGGQHQNGRGGFQFSNHQPFSHRGGGRGGFNNGRYVPEFASPLTLSIPVGGRLSHFSSRWTKITKDPWVLDSVTNGFKVEFSSPPCKFKPQKSPTLGKMQENLCDQEVRALLEKNAIRLSTTSDYVSSLFVIPKKSGGFRPVVNLKPLNVNILYRHFKMEGTAMLKHLLKKGDWMVKIDLQDAYLTVPILPSHCRFLQFEWKGRVYEFTCLPFGLSSAPWGFTKILKPVVAFLRKNGIKLIFYLDDILIISSSKEQAAKDFNIAKGLLEDLGFIVHQTKSIATPSQTIEFLGLIVNSMNLSVFLPDTKVDSIIDLCALAIDKNQISLYEIARILGKFTWATSALNFAQAHYRSLQSQYIDNTKFNSNLERKISLSQEAVRDLRWWVENLKEVNGKPLTVADPDLIIYSDACLSGWGGHCNGVTTRGPWGVDDQNRHINELELSAAFNCLKSFAPHATTISVLLYLDNATAVAYVNKKGGSRSH
jgi:hypothetical protein